MLGRWIAGVVIVGAAIGVMIPTGKRAAPPAPVPATAPKPVAAKPAPIEDMIAAAPSKTVLYRNENGHFYADALVNGQSIRFLVDTGATGVALTLDDARKLGLPFDRNSFEVIGRGASGDVRGARATLHHIAIGRQEAWDLSAVIIDDGLDVSLLGQSWLSHVSNVQISGDTMTLG